MLLMVTGVLELILLSNQFVLYLSHAASGDIVLNTLFKLLALQIPYLLDMLLPLGLFLGILLAFSRLYADSEMTVLIACGISQARLFMLSLGVAIPAIVVVAVMSLWLNPIIYGLQKKIIASSTTDFYMQALMPGRFQSIDHGRKVFYAEKMSRDSKYMHNVFIAEQVSDKSSVVNHWILWSAARGSWLSKFAAVYFVLDNGYRYSGVPGKKNFQISQYAHFGIKLQRRSAEVVKRLHAKSSWDLLQNANTSVTDAAELQFRISLPLSMLVLVALAIPLSRVQPRAGRFARFLPAILLYIIYANLLMVAVDWVAQGTVSPVVGVWWVHLLALGVAGAMWKGKWKFLSRFNQLKIRG